MYQKAEILSCCNVEWLLLKNLNWVLSFIVSSMYNVHTSDSKNCQINKVNVKVLLGKL